MVRKGYNRDRAREGGEAVCMNVGTKANYWGGRLRLLVEDRGRPIDGSRRKLPGPAPAGTWTPGDGVKGGVRLLRGATA